MRPKLIGIFELLFFATIALGLLQIFWNWEDMLQKGLVGFVLAFQIGRVVVLGSLVLLISRRRSKIAMWVLIMLTLLVLLLNANILFSGIFLASTLILVLLTACQMIALALLFLPSSRKWMANKEEATDLTETFS